MSSTTYKTVQLNDGTKIAYREVGDASKPKLVLLHGFPTSSRLFKDLLLLLKDRFHIVAPDIPGYGLTTVADPSTYKFTFENLANAIDAFLDKVGFTTFALYVFDYGAPVGLRIISNPNTNKKVTALITQNGNAYEEGLGTAFWPDLKPAWKLSDEGKLSDKTSEFYLSYTQPLKDALSTLATFSGQYEGGEPANLVDRELGTIDFELLRQNPAYVQEQLDLFLDYRTNIPLYPQFQNYLKEKKIPILAVWGKNDQVFLFQGAEAFKRDNPETAKVVALDAGHFALSSHPVEVAKEIVTFFEERGLF